MLKRVQPEEEARMLLSMFTEGQQKVIGSFFIANGSAAFSKLRSDTENPYSLPAVMAFLDGRVMPSGDHLRWMLIAFSAILIDAFKAPLTEERVRGLLNRFGIGSGMADKIAREVNLPDELTGWQNRFEYAAKWVANVFLPKFLEFSEKPEDIDPNLDLNVAFEYTMLGKALEDLLIMAKMQQVSAMTVLGPGMLEIAAAGDPVAVDRLDKELTGALISTVPWIIPDSEVGGLFSGLKKVVKNVGKAIGKVAAPALSLIPGGGILKSIAAPVLSKVLGGSGASTLAAQQAPASAPASAPQTDVNKLYSVAEIFDKADVPA